MGPLLGKLRLRERELPNSEHSCEIQPGLIVVVNVRTVVSATADSAPRLNGLRNKMEGAIPEGVSRAAVMLALSVFVNMS